MITKIFIYLVVASMLLLETYIVSDRYGWGLATSLVIAGNLVVLAALRWVWHWQDRRIQRDLELRRKLDRIPRCTRCDAPNDVNPADWWACHHCGQEHEPK